MQGIEYRWTGVIASTNPLLNLDKSLKLIWSIFLHEDKVGPKIYLDLIKFIFVEYETDPYPTIQYHCQKNSTESHNIE